MSLPSLFDFSTVRHKDGDARNEDVDENSKLETPRLEEHGHEVSSCESELMRL